MRTDPEEKESSEVLKHQAWLEACQKSTVASIERIQASASRFEQLQPSSSPNTSGTALERYLLERLLLEDERAHLARSRAEDRDKLQIEQLKQVSSLSQHPAAGVSQQVQPAIRPSLSNPVLQQTAMWPSSTAATAPEANKSPGTASGFRSFSITGRAKPPS